MPKSVSSTVPEHRCDTRETAVWIPSCRATRDGRVRRAVTLDISPTHSTSRCLLWRVDPKIEGDPRDKAIQVGTRIEGDHVFVMDLLFPLYLVVELDGICPTAKEGIPWV